MTELQTRQHIPSLEIQGLFFLLYWGICNVARSMKDRSDCDGETSYTEAASVN